MKMGSENFDPIFGNSMLHVFRFKRDTASQFENARRPELAAKERQEAEILQKLLPPAMSELQIDEILKQVIGSLPASTQQPSLGQVFKAFYTQADRSTVRPDVLKQRVQLLLATVSVRPAS